MYEYLLDHKTELMRSVAIYGRTLEDAFKRSGLKAEDWDCISVEYVD